MCGQPGHMSKNCNNNSKNVSSKKLRIKIHQGYALDAGKGSTGEINVDQSLIQKATCEVTTKKLTMQKIKRGARPQSRSRKRIYRAKVL